jgi:hypothetical protein
MAPQSVLILFLNVPPTAIGQSYSPAKFECPDIEALITRYLQFFTFVRRASVGRTRRAFRRRGEVASDRRLSASRAAENRARRVERRDNQSRTTCLGSRFAYSAVRQSPHGRRPGATCDAALGENEPWLTHHLLWLPNSSIEDLGRAKTDARLGVDPRQIVSAAHDDRDAHRT